MEEQKESKQSDIETLVGYSPNNLRENLIDSTIALTTVVSTISYIAYNYSYKVQEIANQAFQLVNDLTRYIEPFVNS